MDAFYASVEQRDRPELRDKPIVVGGTPPRGVVAAASYEARPYGIHSAMPSHKAQQLCPHITFIKPRFTVYRQISKQIRGLFHQYTHLVEPLSLDEAYLDVTPQSPYIHAAADMAKSLRQEIYDTTGLTASAGVSVNKFMAKLASDKNKPDGLTVIKAGEVDQVIQKLPIEEFHGIGPATAAKMKENNIYNGEDLRACSLHELLTLFGKKGNYYYHIARGRDLREVQPDRTRKSVGAETTFRHNLSDPKALVHRLKPITEKVYERLEKAQTTGKTVTIKLKFADFPQITRSYTQSQGVKSLSELFQMSKSLLQAAPAEQRAVRLMGVTVSSLTNEEAPQQLSLSFES
jgi:DNA polymerase-4